MTISSPTTFVVELEHLLDMPPLIHDTCVDSIFPIDSNMFDSKFTEEQMLWKGTST